MYLTEIKYVLETKVSRGQEIEMRSGKQCVNYFDRWIPMRIS